MLRGRRNVAGASPASGSGTIPTSGNALTSPQPRPLQQQQQQQQRRILGRPSGGAVGVGRQQQRSKVVDVSIFVLLGLAALLTLATYLFPEVRDVEKQAEQEIEELMLGHQRQPPLVMTRNGGGGGDDARFLHVGEMSSKWVDGEKKLKKQLERLAQRQSNGIDIGVPVLTRWLGDDIPAWPTDPDNKMDETEWKTKVQAKYQEMRAEEMEWRSQMTRYLDQEERG